MEAANPTRWQKLLIGRLILCKIPKTCNLINLINYFIIERRPIDIGILTPNHMKIFCVFLFLCTLFSCTNLFN
ncbi:hypothetical protein WN944_026471 [Citrus x changshan-huyou]|uniref:Uncharacterized protein n=1 Tax=Citrus x changshan-huyou TaxID=2935761 RepID=A0AAP0QEK9_9ROSI